MNRRPSQEPPKRPEWECMCGKDMRNPKSNHQGWCLYRPKTKVKKHITN
jgi:hypothetical protein